MLLLFPSSVIKSLATCSVQPAFSLFTTCCHRSRCLLLRTSTHFLGNSSSGHQSNHRNFQKQLSTPSCLVLNLSVLTPLTCKFLVPYVPVSVSNLVRTRFIHFFTKHSPFSYLSASKGKATTKQQKEVFVSCVCLFSFFPLSKGFLSLSPLFLRSFTNFTVFPVSFFPSCREAFVVG